MTELPELPRLPLAAHRWAVYFSPSPESPWARGGARWLGRDVDGARVEALQPIAGWSNERWSRLIAEPRRYGWHATLRAPWRLSEACGPADLLGALHGLAADFPAFELPTLRVRQFGGFVALRPQYPCAPLRALAHACVTRLQRFAAPLQPAELARYEGRDLSPRQDAQLRAWGYPYVFDDFHFHITLTGRIDAIPPAQRTALLEYAAARFEALPQPVMFDALSLFAEPDPGAPLRRVARVPLAGVGRFPP